MNQSRRSRRFFCFFQVFEFSGYVEGKGVERRIRFHRIFVGGAIFYVPHGFMTLLSLLHRLHAALLILLTHGVHNGSQDMQATIQAT